MDLSLFEKRAKEAEEQATQLEGLNRTLRANAGALFISRKLPAHLLMAFEDISWLSDLKCLRCELTMLVFDRGRGHPKADQRERGA